MDCFHGNERDYEQESFAYNTRHSIDVIYFDFTKAFVPLVTRNFFINHELMGSVVICYVSSPIFYRIAHSE